MGQVHDILTAQGKQAALEGGLSRDVIEAAASYMGDETGGIGFLYSGWCQSALPHKKLLDDQKWQVDGERISLLVEPGSRIEPGRPPTSVGVPYGSRARLILIYLQSEALRTGRQEIELGRSLRHWFSKMGITAGGKAIADVRDQAERISRCRLTFHITAGKRAGFINQSIVETAMFEADADHPRRRWAFVESVSLSDGFYRELRKHPVPLEEAAIKAMSNNSQALDVYCWLAYRLHALDASTPLSWPAIKNQFGQSVTRMVDFRRKFLPNLELALAVYPDAKVNIEETGVVLHPSRPPVAPKQIQIAAR
jgi:hypothetical protein